MIENTYRRYTPEEDNIIRAKVNNHPENLSEAFRELSIDMGRSENSLSSRWYNYISRQEPVRTSTSFMVLSRRKKVNGRKNITEKNREFLSTNRRTIWNRLINIFR